MATVGSTSSLSSQIDALVLQYQTSLQSRFVEPLQTKKLTVNTRLTVINSLAVKLKALSAAADKLIVTGSTSKFEQYGVTSSLTSTVTGSATAAALAGTHSLLVTQLAKKDIVISNQLTSTATSVSNTEGAGTKTIRLSVDGVNTDVNVSITGTETNVEVLSKIAAAINSSTVTGSSNGGNFVVGDSSAEGGTITAINMTNVAQGTTFTLSKTSTDKLTLTSSAGTSQEVTIAAAVNGAQTIDFSELGVSFTVGAGTAATAEATVDALLTMGTTISKTSTVAASVVGDTSLTSRLVLTSKETGLSHAIAFSDIAGTLLANVGLTASIQAGGRTAVTTTGAGYTYASTLALNSIFAIDGIEITRESNSISDVLTGVTLDLKGTQLLTDTPAQLTVGIDKIKVKAEVQTLLDSFNAALLYLRSQTNTDPTTYKRQTLSGDSTFSSLKMNLQITPGQLVSSVTSGNPNVLYGIGITAAADGTLSISDSAKFDDALAVNSTKVAELFNSSNGVAVKLKTLLSGYVVSKGQMEATSTTLSTQITNFDSRIKAAQERITRQVTRYRDDFARLQTAVSMANQQLAMIQTIMGLV